MQDVAQHAAQHTASFLGAPWYAWGFWVAAGVAVVILLVSFIISPGGSDNQ